MITFFLCYSSQQVSSCQNSDKIQRNYMEKRALSKKLHAKLPLCGEKMTLPEKCLLNVFDHLKQQNTKR